MIGTGFDRPNIRFDAIELKPSARRKFITKWAKTHEGSGIVYCTTIRRCDELSGCLQDAGIEAEAFYAPLSDKEKARIQDGFLTGSPRVICATTAFGMGVDKPDVRWVLNDGPCESVESFYQEAGRAGRDGQPARSVMLWTGGDFLNWERRLADSAGNALDDPKDRAKAQNASTRCDATARPTHAAEASSSTISVTNTTNTATTAATARTSRTATSRPPKERKPPERPHPET